MARTISDLVNVPNAGTAVALSTVDEHVLTITYIAVVGNTGEVYLGDSTVSSTAGFPFQPGDTFSDNPSQADQDTGIIHTILLSDIFIDVANNNDKMAYIAEVIG